MSASIDEYRRRLQLAVEQIRSMEEELDAAEATRNEPIAIIGTACRFPGGANTPEAFHELLMNGIDAVVEIPPERWSSPLFPSGTNSSMERAVRWGAVLRDVDQFDAEFFGISPREASAMDPQQRLLLQVTWEALERAGQLPEQLVGSRTGVFIGLTTNDYMLLGSDRRMSDFELYDATGNGHCFPAGRISYIFGFQGPCFAVDTACSSSLVATHLGCQSLRNQECDLALVGGAQLMLSPIPMALVAKTQGLSPDGRCKAFDARANGFVRGEGIGALVLKRLSDAQRDRDPIAALIIGSSINQDGRSAGFTAPNGKAQVQVLRRALAMARVEPDEVGYIEAHGTGTSLGDPIEAEALREVYGSPRSDGSRCLVGAVKTNVGHLEAAAGIAGLIKIVNIFKHSSIPKNLHFKALNPRISLDGTPLGIPTESMAWPRADKPRRAGISSFGMSGTNAHLVLEDAPDGKSPTICTNARTCHLLTISAKSATGLAALTQSYADWLAEAKDVALGDITYTALMRRTHHEYRIAAVGQSHDEFIDILRQLARNETPADVFRGQVLPTDKLRPVFVFSGQGSQWAGMGRQLHAHEPIFRAKLEEIDALLRSHVAWSLCDELAAPENHSRLDETHIAQPAIFALQVALVALLASWGITPDAVMGHSIGEVAAAHVCGILSLADAVRLVVLRGRIMQKSVGRGKMTWVALSAKDATNALVGFEDQLSIAAINDHSSVVLSGETNALQAVVANLEGRAIVTRPLRVNYAFHSPQMQPLADEFQRDVGHVPQNLPSLPMYSTVTGRRVENGELNSAYWRKNVRATVDFVTAVDTALDDGHRLLIELGPHPVLLANIRQCMSDKNLDARVVPTLLRQRDEGRAMLVMLGQLSVAGLPIDWTKLDGYENARVVDLPAYPWQKQHHWIAVEPNTETGDSSSDVSADLNHGHTLLGNLITIAAFRGTHVAQRRVKPDAPRYLRDHVVGNEIVFPAAGYFELAFGAASQLGHDTPLTLLDVAIHQRMLLDDDGATLQILVEQSDPNGATFQITSRRQENDDWTQHTTGRIEWGRFETAPIAEPLQASSARFSVVRNAEQHYARMDAVQLSYGPAFRGLTQLWREPGHAIARIDLPESVDQTNSHLVHPALLDAAFQAMDGATEGILEGTYLPIAVKRITVWDRVGCGAWVDIRLQPIRDPKAAAAEIDLRLHDESGRVLVEIVGLRIKRLEIRPKRDVLDDCVHHTVWRVNPFSPMSDMAVDIRGTWLILADSRGLSDDLCTRLEAGGAHCIRVVPGPRFLQVHSNLFQLEPTNANDYRMLLREALPGQTSCRGIVHSWNLDAAPADTTTADNLMIDLHRGTVSVLHLAQSLARSGWRDIPPLFVITRGAQGIRVGDPVSPVQSPIWGLCRTLVLENPEITCKRIDLETLPSPTDSLLLAQELTSPDLEDQIAYRNGDRLVARLVRDSFEPRPEFASNLRNLAHDRPYQLWQPVPGVLERVELRALERREPGPGEVEVEVEAAGLNFIDVLMAMGIYPGMAPGGTPLGGEFAGRVVRLGAGVEEFHVGQEVFGSSPMAMATHVIAPSMFIAAKPSHLSFPEAATIPSVFMTAQYALRHLGRAMPGETILIHSATGGTGLAAIQMARALGLEIFATAGSDEKRAFLKAMGIRHVMDSRTLDFVDEVKVATNGRGVDIVLNSLTGDAIVKGLEILAPYGRFLELGKRDIYDNHRLGLLPFRKSISYTAIDLAGMITDKPKLYAEVFHAVAAQFDAKTLDPLPLRIFSASRAEDALRLMAQARQIGKIAIEMRDPAARLANAHESTTTRVRADASYLVTGGLGGLGLKVAAWLVERGARHLILVSRSMPTPEAQNAIATMRNAGAEVRTLQADVSRADSVAAVCEMIAPNVPLRGIVHAAGVLEDHSLLELSRPHFDRVFAPKVLGTWHLHEQTRAIPLDFFFLYSSSAGLVGSPGQANYAAANVFMDAFAHHRIALGLPATSVQWGPFSDVGMAATLHERGGRAGTRGIAPLSPSEGTMVLDRLLARPRPVIGVLRIDTRRFREFYPQIAVSPFWSELHTDGASDDETTVSSIREHIESAPAAEKGPRLERYLMDQLARVLRLGANQIGRETPFRTLGVDSLMSLEMRNRVESDLQLKLPSTLLFTYPNVATLAEYLLTRLCPPPTIPHETVTPIPLQSTSVEQAPLPEAGAEDFLAAFDASLDALKDSEFE